jgi:outer membrane lipase/esterase
MVCNLVVFGDSLSDTGNVLKVTNGLFPATKLDKNGKPISGFGTTFDYNTGRFTNGPGAIPAATRYQGVWHEQLAGMLGLPVASPSLLGGTDYAYGGARTSDGTHKVAGYTINDMGTQVRDFLSLGGAPAKNLYVLWGGGNDLIDATRNFFAKPADVLDAERQAILNLTVEFKLLADSGATTFLWPDLPPLDKTPYAQGLSAALRGALATASADFASDEAGVISGLEAFYGPRIQIVQMDVYGFFNSILASPGESGYVNVTSPAQDQNVNPDRYLFWDNLHPTTRGHHDLAVLADRDLRQAGISPCPEPSSVVLITLAVPFLLYRWGGRVRERP